MFYKGRNFEKSAEEAINDQDDLFKHLTAEELEETINEFRERFSNEVVEELNAAVLLDMDTELSANADKPSEKKSHSKKKETKNYQILL